MNDPANPDPTGTVTTPPVTTTPPVEPPAPPDPLTWPDKWREGYVAARKGDEKMLAQLQRYTAPDAALDALLGVQQKISRGELRAATPFPANGTPEQQAEWRRSQGVPEAPDKYEVKLAPGRVIGEDDKPMIDSFLKHAHGKNLPAGHVNEVLNWYYDTIEQGEAARAKADEEIRGQLEQRLNTEWGKDYVANKNAIGAFLDMAPTGLKEQILSARMADGTPLMSNYDAVRWFAQLAREMNPVQGLTPSDFASGKGAADEIADLKTMMGNKNSDYWKGPRAATLQARYRQLLEWQSRQKAA